ncbi:hypothetical protein N9971_00905, partial [bacterium]|nr:hypothetical protein [bacterium]
MTGAWLDLDGESRRALQYDDLLEAVAGHARTPPGVSAVRGTRPSADGAYIRRELEAVGQTIRHLDRQGALVPGGLPDPRPHMNLLTIEGGSLAATALRDLAAVLMAAADLRRHLTEADPESDSALADLGRGTPDLRAESRVILGNIDPDGRVADEASPELRRLRSAQSKLSARLHGLLTRMVRDPSAEAVIQDDFITQRNGRYVIPIRTDAPRPVPGIIHAASSSGATRFVEPMESVEMNNELAGLAEAEHEELERILRAWSDSLRARIDDVRAAFEALTIADAWQAR